MPLIVSGSGEAAIAARIGVNTSTNGTSSRAASDRIASV